MMPETCSGMPQFIPQISVHLLCACNYQVTLVWHLCRIPHICFCVAKISSCAARFRVCVHMSVNVSLCMYIYQCLICVNIYRNVCVCLDMNVCDCIYTYVYVCIRTRTYANAYMHTRSVCTTICACMPTFVYVKCACSWGYLWGAHKMLYACIQHKTHMYTSTSAGSFDDTRVFCSSPSAGHHGRFQHKYKCASSGCKFGIHQCGTNLFMCR
jgi:hypothetical protein